MFFLFFLNCRFILIFILIYILGITIGYLLIEKITRDRKRLKKISINSFITREVFNR
jgi:prolipoprotein diacylglyceryltransferase